jgi:photosystem II stability/assembly factor-like uncharacterized protein
MKNLKFLLLIFFTITQISQAQWFIRNSGTTNNLRAVSYINPNVISIVGEFGTILKSTNGGFNWFFQSSNTAEDLYSVDFKDENYGIAVGRNGTIIKTTNGGINWIVQNSGTTNILNCVSCFNRDNCIVVGTGGLILNTSDGGYTWDIISSGTTKNLNGVFFLDSSKIIVVALETIMISTNRGVDWTYHPDAAGNLLRGIDCIDELNCLIVGYIGKILKTSDGGLTWESLTSITTKNLFSVSFTNLNYANVVGAIGTIVGTTDGGINWMNQPGWTNQNLFGVSFVNPDTGIAVGNNGVIRMTYTAGIPVELTSFNAISKKGYVELTWETATELNNHIFEIERKSESSDYRLIGFVEGAGTITEPQKYFFVDKYVDCGKHYYRLKQIDFDGSFQYSDEVEVFTIGDMNFNLIQNYPNPFNPNTVISFQLPVSGVVTLKVYDVLGNEIATLVNEEKQPGTYEVEFSPESSIKYPASGIYFYQLRAGDFVETKKMVLLK